MLSKEEYMVLVQVIERHPFLLAAEQLVVRQIMHKLYPREEEGPEQKTEPAPTVPEESLDASPAGEAGHALGQ